MRSSVDLLARWMEMDRLLYRRELVTDEAATKWGITHRQVDRYRQVFEVLGYVVKAEVRKARGRPGVVWTWGYPDGQRPMFTASEEEPLDRRTE